MFTDIAGYTSLSQKNEALAMQLLEEHRRLVRPHFPRYNGREVKTVGDAFLVEFGSALEAVRCAFDIQQSMHEMNMGRPLERQVQLRIGVHVGDVIHNQNDVYGDAVNVAERIQHLAVPGGVCVSQQVCDHVRNKLEFPLLSLGKKELKNVDEPMVVFKLVFPWEQASAAMTSFPRDRIAILPFANMSPDPNDEYFADGMTEEIISTVSGISGLKVISRTSVMRYKKTDRAVKDIGKELEVGSVLEGSFRKAGNRIRVTTQLIDVAGDEHLWAQNYDRNLDDVFEVQSDIAKQVADALRVRILAPEAKRIEKKPTESTAAYTLYLKGRYFWNKREISDLREAAGYFERAVMEDENFALGYVGQADCCLLLRNNWNIDLVENLAKAKRMLTKALELNPDLAEAHASKGLMLNQDYDLRGAEAEFRKAIELKPSYTMAHMWYHLILVDEMRWAEAQEEIEKAMELDPLSPVVNSNHASFYSAMRDYEKALELWVRVVALEPNAGGLHGSLAGAYGRLGKFDEMKRESAKAAELLAKSFPLVNKAFEGMIAFWEGDKATLRRLLSELEQEGHLKEASLDSYTVGTTYIYLGEHDRGFEWLMRSYSEREGSLLSIKVDPVLDGVRTDSRYLDLLKRLGLD